MCIAEGGPGRDSRLCVLQETLEKECASSEGPPGSEYSEPCVMQRSRSEDAPWSSGYPAYRSGLGTCSYNFGKSPIHNMEGGVYNGSSVNIYISHIIYRLGNL